MIKAQRHLAFDSVTKHVQRLYDRAAPIYNWFEGPLERRFEPLRRCIWSMVEGSDILEIGVGTGRNIPFYPKDASVTAIDFSNRMLEYAKRYAREQRSSADLTQMDAQSLGFPDDSFDTVVATLVYCTVPDPLRGLAEARRVTRPSGKMIFLEHVRPDGIFGMAADIINPLSVALLGEHLNRRTVDIIRRSGVDVREVWDLNSPLFRLIVAGPGKSQEKAAW